jgi:hypothetical protein
MFRVLFAPIIRSTTVAYIHRFCICGKQVLVSSGVVVYFIWICVYSFFEASCDILCWCVCAGVWPHTHTSTKTSVFHRYKTYGCKLQLYSWWWVQIAPETCRAYNIVKNNKDYEAYLIGLYSLILRASPRNDNNYFSELLLKNTENKNTKTNTLFGGMFRYQHHKHWKFRHGNATITFIHYCCSLYRWPTCVAVNNMKALMSSCKVTDNFFPILSTEWGTRWLSGCGTAPQTRMSRDRFPMDLLEFFIDIILPAAIWPWGRLSL